MSWWSRLPKERSLSTSFVVDKFLENRNRPPFNGGSGFGRTSALQLKDTAINHFGCRHHCVVLIIFAGLKQALLSAPRLG